MGFETQPIAEAITLESLKLPNPIHNAAADGSPIIFAVGLVHHILAVAVPDALFREQLIASWVGCASYGCGMPGSQFSMKFSFGIAFNTAADSSPVAVLQDISFSSKSTRLSLEQRSAAFCSLALIAARYGF